MQSIKTSAKPGGSKSGRNVKIEVQFGAEVIFRPLGFDSVWCIMVSVGPLTLNADG